MTNTRNFAVNQHAKTIVNRSVFVSGSARSGTTIMGKYIGSLKNYEYYFEPPMLFQILADADNLPPKIFRRMLITYLYEDLFCGSISGRNLNFRAEDDTYIYNIKSRNEIENRLTGNFRKSMLKENYSRLAFKIPDFVYREKLYQNIFPQSKIIRMVRDPSETISSLIKKAWFSSENIIRDDIVWPNEKYPNGFVPHFVPEQYKHEWTKLTEIDRCLVYYKSQTPYYTPSEKSLIVRYSDLLYELSKVTRSVHNFLEASETEASDSILGSISSQDSTSKQNFNSASAELLRQAFDSYESYPKITCS